MIIQKYLNLKSNSNWYVLFLALLITPGKITANDDKNPYPLHFLMRSLNEVIINDNISPPQAARIYAYSQIAAFYILSNNESGVNLKIYEAIPHFPKIDISKFRKGYSPELAASYAFFYVSKKLIYTEKPLIDSFQVLLKWFEVKPLIKIKMESSEEVGRIVSEEIIKWMHKDLFLETRTYNKFILKSITGSWQPTSPGYFQALEPHWGELRTMICNKDSEPFLISPVVFDTSNTSAYSKQVMEVYKKVINLTDEEKSVANFWDCNPFALKLHGHQNEIIKKLSPGGHWISITGQACLIKGMDIYKTSEALTITAITIYDAFIITWNLKYEYTTARPETIIQQSLKQDWEPFIQSPPFPEFPSGHAVVSNAAQVVLSSLFGDSFAFVDNAEEYLGLPPRSFKSFKQAAEEATLSRYYGGIHFLPSCMEGKDLGIKIGETIVEKLELNKKH